MSSSDKDDKKTIKILKFKKKDEMKAYKTLRGFVEGVEEEEEIYFNYSASLRIFGTIADFDEITNTLKLSPTSVHRKGKRRGPKSPPYKHDMWSHTVQVDEKEHLEKHIDTLWSKIKANKEYLMELKKSLTVDIFLGYITNCDHGGIEIPHTSLEMFIELEIPFGLSIIC